MRALASWVRLWDRREPADALAAVRILVALVLLWDLMLVARFELVEALWAPVEEGGIGPATFERPVVATYRVLGTSAAGAWLLYGTAVLSSVTLAAGLFTRVSAWVALLSLAQLAHLSPDASRGIDALLRNVLLVLAFSRAGATLSVEARLRGGRWVDTTPVPAWPRYLLVAQLVLLYFWSGALKQSPSWTSIDGYSALFFVLQQPHYASFELAPETLDLLYPLLQLATATTVAFERAAPLLPLLLYFRATRERPGRLRALANRARLLELWIATGVVFHLTLAVTVELGIFPWGCLALYPALASPDAAARVRSLVQRRSR